MVLRGQQRPVLATGAAPAPAPIRRRDDPLRTLTVTRPWTTVVTTITLGAAPPPPSPTGPTAASTLTIDAMAPPYGTAPPANVVRSADLTQDQIGAVIGAVVGAVLLLLVVWYCLSQARLRRVHERRHGRWADDSSGDGYGSGSSSESSSSRRRRRRRSNGSRRARQLMPRPPPAAYAGRPAFNLTTPPTTFPPSQRQGYRQTVNPQIRGVKRYP